MSEALSSSEWPLPNRAVYAGSFDPPTRGHEWVIEEGAHRYDELHVAVAVNPSKTYMFSVDERVDMLEDLTSHMPNVTVGHFENIFTVRYAQKNGYPFLLRGLRDTSDFRNELALEHLNSDIDPTIRTDYVGCPREFTEVSSSTVKAFMGPEGWQEEVARLVSPKVLDALVRKEKERRERAQLITELGHADEGHILTGVLNNLLGRLPSLRRK